MEKVINIKNKKKEGIKWQRTKRTKRRIKRGKTRKKGKET